MCLARDADAAAAAGQLGEDEQQGPPVNAAGFLMAMSRQISVDKTALCDRSHYGYLQPSSHDLWAKRSAQNA